jgi:cytochrome b6-f complex iron-sulfur subunit
MNPTTIFILILVAAALIAVVGIVVVARGRVDADGVADSAQLDSRAKKADKDRRRAKAKAASAENGKEPDVGSTVAVADPPAEYRKDDPKIEVTPVEYGVTRRKFFNRAIGAVFGLFMLQFALAGLAFFWPKLKGGFGTPINAGTVKDLKAEVLQAGVVMPKAIPAAQAWIIPFDMEKLDASQFAEVPFVIAGGEDDGIGLMALWHRCVHLGCRVPECIPSQGFECPCHGSKYNAHGEYAAGPAPRNLDRFSVSVNGSGELVIDTGTVVQTPRAKEFTIPYPQGPFCVG